MRIEHSFWEDKKIEINTCNYESIKGKIKELFALHGIVKLKVDEFCPRELYNLIDVISRKVYNNDTREFAKKLDDEKKYSDVVFQPDYSNWGLPLHKDGGSSMPFSVGPNAMALYCEVPAGKGGDTLLCSGSAILMELSDELKNTLRNKKFLFQQKYSKAEWLSYFRLGNEDSPEKALDVLLNTQLGIDYQLEEDGVVHGITEPFVLTDRNDVDYLVAPLFLSNNQMDAFMFEDGTAIPSDLVDEITRVAKEATIEFKLEAGEILIIDNFRWYHGRKRIRDINTRVMYLVQFDLDDDSIGYRWTGGGELLEQ